MSSLPDVAVRRVGVRELGVGLLLSLVALFCGAASAATNPSRPGSDAPAANDPSPNLVELAQGWHLVSADQVTADDSAISSPAFDASHWYEVRRMPATVLE